MWRLSILIVTDRRVIDLEQVGLFKTEIHELRCMKIKSVKTKKIGVIGLFNLGAIRIYSKKSQKYDIEFYGVKNPDHVRELLLEVKCLRRGHLKKVKEQSDPKPKTIVHEREETSISDSE